MDDLEVLLPKRLTEEVKLGLFAPADPLTDARQRRLERVRSQLPEGLEFVFPPNLFRSNHLRAGSPQERIADLVSLLNSEECNALLAAWGGKNSNELIGELPLDLIVARRVPIMAFSDGCVLLNWISGRTGLVTFYGPNVAGKFDQTMHSDLRLLKGQSIPAFGYQAASLAEVIRPGVADGVLMGGNLSSFAVLLMDSSPFWNRYQKIVLFWESAYIGSTSIRRLLVAIVRSAFGAQVSAMVVGDFGLGRERGEVANVIDACAWVGDELGVPVLWIPTFGHANLENPVIPIGWPISIVTSPMSLSHAIPVFD